MIELIASGPVRRITEERIDRRDGHDRIYGRVETVRTEEIRMDLEFPQGYVNLEGYAPSSPGSVNPLGSVAYHLPDGAEPVAGEWNVRLEGEWWDWIQAAHRYQTERPDRSIIEILKIFRGWDETRGETLQRAADVVANETALGSVEMGEMDSESYYQLQRDLGDIQGVNIPESYSQ